MLKFFEDFLATIAESGLEDFQPAFEQQLAHHYQPHLHGDYGRWTQAFGLLPEVPGSTVATNVDTIYVGRSEDLTASEHAALIEALRALMPWRKGPFNFFGHHIDTEWRSDFKWQRLLPAISPLQGRTVLDVGCGSGYHCWRMWGAGARYVLGIDSSPKFLFQFQAVKKYTPHAPVHYLPLRSDCLPGKMQCFDTVFSMGVIYHCRSPFEHIEELKGAIRPGGELVLETLVIPGDENSVLSPSNRYAKMRNVWFIGSALATQRWLTRCGFINVNIVNETMTTAAEQRRTDWMTFNSLTDFLDPDDSSKTVEGYPAPRRAILVATKQG